MQKSLFLILILISTFCMNGQRKNEYDSSYYERFPDKITGRVYLSQKFLKFTIPPNGNQTDIEYKANTKLNLGIGITYKNISANIFYGFAFLNKDTAKGETKGLDLQLHVYPRRWAIDLTVLVPKGYHIFPKGYASTNPNTYYHRPDIQLKLFGLSAYRVPNKERFSYRAAITLNEWQKKSAGSLLYGGIIYYGTAKGDSALVPKKIESSFPQKEISNLSFMAIGAGGGYAHTLVIDNHFFITASAIVNLDMTLTSEDGQNLSKAGKTSVCPSIVAKAAIGYNSSTWAIGLNSLGTALWTKGNTSAKNYYMPTGQVRLIVSRKFYTHKHSQRL